MGDAARIEPREWRDVLLAGLPLVLWTALCWPFEVDDAYISLRHAYNWATHGLLSFNPWGPPIEGYSNFAQVAFAAALFKLGLDPAPILKVLGVLWAYATVPLVYALLRRLAAPRGTALLGCLLFSLSSGFGFWAVAGLETTFYTFVFTLGLCWFLAERPGTDLLASTAFVLAALTRPEAPVFVGALGLWRVAGQALGREPVLRIVRGNAPWALLFLLLYGGYFYARWRYFGHLLPNSTYWKAGEPGDWATSLGADFLRRWWPFLGVAALSPLAPGKARGRTLPLLMTLAALAVFLRAQEAVAGNVRTMAYFSRYFLPVLPCLAAAAALGVLALRARAPKAATAAAAGLVLWQLLNPDANPYRTTRKARTSGPLADSRTIPVGRYLHERIGEKGSVAVGDCGRIPFFFRGYVYDTFGLNSYVFTRELGKDVGRYADYILAQRPDAVVACYGNKDGKPGGERGRNCQRPDEVLTAKPAFRENYRETRVFGEAESPSYYYVVFERADRLPPP